MLIVGWLIAMHWTMGKQQLVRVVKGLDKAWSFGIRSAVQSAQRISDSVNWCYFTQEHGGHAPLIREALGLSDSLTDEEIEMCEDPEELFNWTRRSPDLQGHSSYKS